MHKFLIAVPLLVVPLHAWGPVGHSLVARIADIQLTEAAHARVAEILGPDRTMSSIASWADEVRNVRRQTAPWHFIDIPITERQLDMARDCPKNECILAKLHELLNVLHNPMTAEPDQHPATRLDDVVHQRVRLGVLTVAHQARRVEFGFLRTALGLTAGNLSQHLAVLEKAGLISIEKGYEGRRPRTWLTLTPAGDRALQNEVTQLKRLIHQIEQGGPAVES